jgi:hypothetical protein
MKLLILSILSVFVVGAAFVVGVLTQTTWLLAVGFCSWTPAILMVGYAIRASGVKLVAVSLADANERPAMHRNSRSREAIQKSIRSLEQ